MHQLSALRALTNLMVAQEKATGEMPDTYRATPEAYVDIMFEVMQAHARTKKVFGCFTQNWFMFVLNENRVCVYVSDDIDTHEMFDDEEEDP